MFTQNIEIKSTLSENIGFWKQNVHEGDGELQRLCVTWLSSVRSLGKLNIWLLKESSRSYCRFVCLFESVNVRQHYKAIGHVHGGDQGRLFGSFIELRPKARRPQLVVGWVDLKGRAMRTRV